MRKIISQEERAKKSKRNQIIIAIILLSLMIFSTIGYAFVNNTSSTSANEQIEYNGIIFVHESDYWRFIFNNYEFLTRYNPEETSAISLSGSLSLPDYTNVPLYFVGENGEHFTEIERNLDRFVLRTSRACLAAELCVENLPIKDCTLDNLIIYRAFNETTDTTEKIYQQDKCTYIIARAENQARYADALLFKVLGL
ncbi:MAG: hypothetical protein RL557_551 [archaeon]